MRVKEEKRERRGREGRERVGEGGQRGREKGEGGRRERRRREGGGGRGRRGVIKAKGKERGESYIPCAGKALYNATSRVISLPTVSQVYL